MKLNIKTTLVVAVFASLVPAGAALAASSYQGICKSSNGICGPYYAYQVTSTEITGNTTVNNFVFIAPSTSTAKDPFPGIGAVGNASNTFLDPVLNLDPNGAVGQKTYLQWLDGPLPLVQAFDKTSGSPLIVGNKGSTSTIPVPVTISSLFKFSGLGCSNDPGGNGMATYDITAGRYIVGWRVEDNIKQNFGPPYYFCWAISSGDNLASSTWYIYQFALAGYPWTATSSVIPAMQEKDPNGNLSPMFPDYPRISTWDNAYYATFDLLDNYNPDVPGEATGFETCAFDRSDMVLGTTPKPASCYIYQPPGTTSSTPSYVYTALPADLDSSDTPPSNTEYLMQLGLPTSSAENATANYMNEFKTSINFNSCSGNPITCSSSTFSGPIKITTHSYTPACWWFGPGTGQQTGVTQCVPQPMTSSTIDSLGDRLVSRLSYHNFPASSTESLVVTHAVDMDPNGTSSDPHYTGIHDVVIHNPGGTPQVVQDHLTYDPTGKHWYFIPSAAQNQFQRVGLVFESVCPSCSTPQYPSVNFMVWGGAASGTISTYQTGIGYDGNNHFFGGYFSVGVDPTDSTSFWTGGEYFKANQYGNPSSPTSTCSTYAGNNNTLTGQCYEWATEVFKCTPNHVTLACM